ncbi:MAG: GIY-YIG nuclease family protein [Verrucomicrobiota bacterium]
MDLGVAGSSPVGRPILCSTGQACITFTYWSARKQVGTYVGHTDNLIRRFHLHLAGSTRTTREQLLEPVMAHGESFPTRSEAMKRERYFKATQGID